MSYYTKITKAGLAAITAAMNNNTKVPITYMAFGDGNGYIPEPDEDASSLVNEVYRAGLNKVEVHSKNPNWLVCEAIIPSAVGGFNIREVALYDNTGNTMLAIASYPPTYKPTLAEGSAKIQTIRIIIQVDNSGNFELIVDPDVVLATIDYVNQKLLEVDISTIMVGDEDLGNYLGKLTKCVKTITDLKALQPRFNNERVFVRERHDGFGCGGGFFEYVESSTKTEDSGLFFNSVSTGKWHRIFDGAVQMSWFYSGNWDDAIDAAIASMSLNFGGGELEVPRQQDVIIQRSHQINRPILIKGTYTGAKTNLDQNENSGTLYIADGVTAFKFGIFGNVPSRMFGGGVVGVSATTLGGYTQGHVSQLYGSQNEAFGFRSITTTLAGAKNKDTGVNLTNCLCEVNYAFAPFKFEDNFITGLGTPFKDTAANYDVKPRNNFIRWCSVGMYMGSPGVPTTISFKDNTIERCAIGLHINYPSQMVRVDGGVIEANYAGCDILLFNATHSMDINNIYFEASPNNIVIRGDSALYTAHNLKIYKCTGVHVYTRANARNITIEDSWLEGLDLNPFADGYISNIVLKDNWDKTSATKKFTPTPDNIKLNSVAAAMADEITVIDTSNYIKNVPLINASMDLVKPARAINKLVNTSTTANNVPTLTLKVPNIFTNAVAKITILKYVGESLTQSPRYYEYLFAIRRVAGQTTLYEFQELTKKSFATMGATEVLDNAAPTVTVNGTATEEQTLVLNMVNGQTGGNSGYSLLSVDWLSSTAGLDIK